MSRSRERRALERLLELRNEHPERLADIDRRIRERFEHELAVLVLDMCGFSRLTIRHGIIHYLALIQRMQRIVLPIVSAGRGRVVKTEADNVFAVFERVPAAVRAALRIQRELARANAVLPADWDVQVGIGIGFGPLLAIGDDDLYGEEMNLASKLGEDVAQAGAVLLTEAAFQRAGVTRRAFVARKARLGRLSLTYHALRKPAR